jgi:hypothetical protein
MENKCCKRCQQVFPLTDQHWYKKRILKDSNQGKKLGLTKDYTTYRHVCKKCNGAIGVERSRKKRCKELGCTDAEYKEAYLKEVRKTKRKYDYGDTFDKTLTPKEMMGKYKEIITPCYISQNLRIPREKVTSEIENLAKEKILYHRKRNKELKTKTAEELAKEERERMRNFQLKYRKTLKYSIWKNEYDRKNKENLTDSYVIACMSLPPGIKRVEIPNNLIETKRKYLKLIRNAKKQKENNSK